MPLLSRKCQIFTKRLRPCRDDSGEIGPDLNRECPVSRYEQLVLVDGNFYKILKNRYKKQNNPLYIGLQCAVSKTSSFAVHKCGGSEKTT